MLRNRFPACLVAGLAVLVAASPVARAGKLGKANDRIQGTGSTSSSNSSSSSDDDDDDDDDGGDWSWNSDSSSSNSSSSSSTGHGGGGIRADWGSEAAAMVTCLVTVVGWPWCIPYGALEMGADSDDWTYEPYPYRGGSSRGYVTSVTDRGASSAASSSAPSSTSGED